MPDARGAARRVAEAASPWATVAAFLAAAFSCWAAWEAHNGVTAAREATRSTLLTQLVTEYGGSEIFESIQALRGWQEQHTQSPAAAFGELDRSMASSQEGAKQYDQLVRSLRVVSSYFEKLQLMSEGNLIDKRLLRQLWSCSTYTDLVAKLVVPMNVTRVDVLVEKKLLKPHARKAAREEAKSQLAFYRQALCPSCEDLNREAAEYRRRLDEHRSGPADTTEWQEDLDQTAGLIADLGCKPAS